MELISVFIFLVIGFLVIGIIAAIAYNRNDHNDAEDEQARIVISQEVPSAFDALKGKKRR